MKRRAQEGRLLRKRQQFWWEVCRGQLPLDPPGYFRKRKPLDCGRSRCYVCASHKYPKRRLSRAELQAQLAAREQMRDYR